MTTPRGYFDRPYESLQEDDGVETSALIGVVPDANLPQGSEAELTTGTETQRKVWSAEELREQVEGFTGQSSRTGTIDPSRIPPSELDVVVLDTTQAFVARGPDADAGGTGNSLNLQFIIGNQTYTIRRLYFDDDDSKLVIDLNNFNEHQKANLNRVTITINGVAYDFRHATYTDYTQADATREAEFARVGSQPSPGTYRIRVYLRPTFDQSPAGISKLPVPLVTHERYLLLAQDTITQDRLITALQEQVGSLRGLEMNTGGVNAVSGVRAYSPTHATTALRNRVALMLHGTPTSAATKIRLGTTLTGIEEYEVASTIVPGVQHTYLVTGLDYNSLEPGTSYYVNVIFTDGSLAYPSTIVAPGDWVATGPRTLAHTPGSPALWAALGNTTLKVPESLLPFQTEDFAKVGNPALVPIPKQAVAGLSILADNQTSVGISVTNSNTDTREAPVGFTPVFDLDTAGNGAGVLNVSMTATISGRSLNTIAWISATSQDAADDNLTVSFRDEVIISDLLRTPVYDGQFDYGIELDDSLHVYAGADLLGDVKFYLTRDSNNQVGIWLFYEGMAGSHSFSIGSTVTVVLQRTDSGMPRLVADAVDYTLPADVVVPTPGSTAFGTTYTEIWRLTNSSMETKRYTVDASLYPQPAWTRQGGDRGSIRFRVRILSSADVVKQTIIPMHQTYLRNFDLDGLDTESSMLTVEADLAAGDYLVIDAVAMRQLGATGGVTPPTASPSSVNVIAANSRIQTREL